MNTRITLKVLEENITHLNRVQAKYAGTGIISYDLSAENGNYYLGKLVDGDYRGNVAVGTKRELMIFVSAMKTALYAVGDAKYLEAQKESKA